MNTILIISILLLAATAIALRYFSRKPEHEVEPRRLETPQFSGLFDNQFDNQFDNGETAKLLAQAEADERRTELLRRAAEGDFETLAEAYELDDADLYRLTLDSLTSRAIVNGDDLVAFASRITRSGKLRANAALADALVERLKGFPDKRLLIETLSIAALSDDAAAYQRAIEAAVSMWRLGKLQDVPAEALSQLIESHYWTLAPGARESGAGFLLKRTLVEVRRELAAATGRACGLA